MSKPRYDWWGYVKGMIRRYPQLKEEYEELHRQAMRVDYSGMPRGGGSHRATEDLALRALPASKQREFDAVRKAIESTAIQSLSLIHIFGSWSGGQIFGWPSSGRSGQSTPRRSCARSAPRHKRSGRSWRRL